jgi:general secretion pathway protein K
MRRWRPITTTLANSRGIALVPVLWAVVLLSALAASFVSTARTTTTLAHNQLESAQASAIAEAGVFRTIAGLIVRSNARSPRGAQGDETAALADAEGNAMSADPALWRMDGTVYSWRYADADLLISIQAEDGKIDLNAAPNDLLKALLVSNGVDEARKTGSE